MDDHRTVDQEGPDTGITSPDAPTHEATSPPSNPDVDEDARRAGEENIGRAGSGH